MVSRPSCKPDVVFAGHLHSGQSAISINVIHQLSTHAQLEAVESYLSMILDDTSNENVV